LIASSLDCCQRRSWRVTTASIAALRSASSDDGRESRSRIQAWSSARVPGNAAGGPPGIAGAASTGGMAAVMRRRSLDKSDIILHVRLGFPTVRLTNGVPAPPSTARDGDAPGRKSLPGQTTERLRSHIRETRRATRRCRMPCKFASFVADRCALPAPLACRNRHGPAPLGNTDNIQRAAPSVRPMHAGARRCHSGGGRPLPLF
jgi:hypothetical protein